jgi:hypothetical protein
MRVVSRLSGMGLVEGLVAGIGPMQFCVSWTHGADLRLLLIDNHGTSQHHIHVNTDFSLRPCQYT